MNNNRNGTYVLPVPSPNGSLVGKQDESSLGIHRGYCHGDLDDFSLGLCPEAELEKERLFLRRLNFVESRVDAPLQVFQLVEHVQKFIGLPSLNLPVLDGGSSQKIVGLHHLVGGGPVFVLRRFRSNPDVHVVHQIGRVAP